MTQPPKDLKSFSALVEIVEALRGPEGCPWDKEQTHASLVPFAIEEAYEFAEAVEVSHAAQGNSQETEDRKQADAEMASELGDMLLQVVLHAEIAKQRNAFSIEEVLEAINSKMIRRHPHVFADEVATNSSEVLAQWDILKQKEKKPKPNDRFDIPNALPALLRASKIGAKTNQLKFDWQNALQVWPKVEEELLELKQALDSLQWSAPKIQLTEKDVASEQKPPLLQHLEHEIGDVLFSVAQLARHMNVDPEQALRVANQRFEQRFFTMQKITQDEGLSWHLLSDEEKEIQWKKSKDRLAKQ